MYLAPPVAYGQLRELLARQAGADFIDPITAGIFVSLAAWDSAQRAGDKTPYWRTLKAGGELNPKYPGGVEAQWARLEAEGHTVLGGGAPISGILWRIWRARSLICSFSLFRLVLPKAALSNKLEVFNGSNLISR